MWLELYARGYVRPFKNPEIGHSVIFGACGSILASAISRMSKSRYKVYVITQTDVFETVCSGVGEAMDILQDFYNRA